MHGEQASPRGLSGKRSGAMQNDLWAKVQLRSEPVGVPVIRGLKGALAKVDGWLYTGCGLAFFILGC